MSKLRLAKETIAELATGDLALVAAGGDTDYCSCPFLSCFTQDFHPAQTMTCSCVSCYACNG